MFTAVISQAALGVNHLSVWLPARGLVTETVVAFRGQMICAICVRVVVCWVAVSKVAEGAVVYVIEGAVGFPPPATV